MFADKIERLDYLRELASGKRAGKEQPLSSPEVEQPRVSQQRGLGDLTDCGVDAAQPTHLASLHTTQTSKPLPSPVRCGAEGMSNGLKSSLGGRSTVGGPLSLVLCPNDFPRAASHQTEAKI